MDTYLRKNYQENKRNIIYGKNHSKKTISTTMQKLEHIFALWEKFYTEEKHTNIKTNKKMTYQTNESKNCIIKEICCNKKNYRTIQYYNNPSKIRMQRKMETD